MDWLSKLRVEIVCHERIIRIPLPNGDVLEVHGERSEENLKHLASMKAGEKKLKDIPIIRDFPRVFPDNLTILPPIRPVEFRIDLIPEATPVAKAPHIRLLIKGKKHGRMMLDSIDNGLLVYPTIEENMHTRPKNNSKLTEAQQLQDDCDVQATNINIHGLLPDVYALVNHQEAAKDIWDRVKLLMKGTELSYQECECRLYNLFDKFASIQGETLYEYYWRFSQMIHIHTIGMTMQQVQVNAKFLNALPSE
ncbi:hypothetical protein Tco_0237859 [Tanacetum coccineum]